MCCFLMSEEPNPRNLSFPFPPLLCLFWRVLAAGPVILCWGWCRAGAESRARLCIHRQCLAVLNSAVHVLPSTSLTMVM